MPLKELGSTERFLQREGGRRRENRKEPWRAEELGRGPCPGVAPRSLCEPEQTAFLFWDSVSLSAKPEGWSSLWSANGERQRKAGKEGWTGHPGKRGAILPLQSTRGLGGQLPVGRAKAKPFC